ncbi:hypothetical protein V8E53_001791 [Lactarius tabidus]
MASQYPITHGPHTCRSARSFDRLSSVLSSSLPVHTQCCSMATLDSYVKGERGVGEVVNSSKVRLPSLRFFIFFLWSEDWQPPPRTRKTKSMKVHIRVRHRCHNCHHQHARPYTRSRLISPRVLACVRPLYLTCMSRFHVYNSCVPVSQRILSFPAVLRLVLGYLSVKVVSNVARGRSRLQAPTDFLGTVVVRGSGLVGAARNNLQYVDDRLETSCRSVPLYYSMTGICQVVGTPQF